MTAMTYLVLEYIIVTSLILEYIHVTSLVLVYIIVNIDRSETQCASHLFLCSPSQLKNHHWSNISPVTFCFVQMVLLPVLL
jgi:hypothetical protein